MRADLERFRREAERVDMSRGCLRARAQRHPWFGRRAGRVLASAGGALLAALIAAGVYYRSHRRTPLTDKDTVVVTDFANSTGDAVFDDTLKTALTIALSQSPFLNVLAESKANATLKLMKRAQAHA